MRAIVLIVLIVACQADEAPVSSDNPLRGLNHVVLQILAPKTIDAPRVADSIRNAFTGSGLRVHLSIDTIDASQYSATGWITADVSFTDPAPNGTVAYIATMRLKQLVRTRSGGDGVAVTDQRLIYGTMHSREVPARQWASDFFLMAENMSEEYKRQNAAPKD